MSTQEILLVEDSVVDAFLVSQTIEKYLPGRFQINHQMSMAQAESCIKEHKDNIGLILLDLGLPDTKDGRDTFNRMKAYAQEIPIVVLTGLKDHDLALALVSEGAEDFVNKGLIHENPEHLRDILEFAACRHQLQSAVNKEHEGKLKDKDEVISWMAGGYSVK